MAAAEQFKFILCELFVDEDNIEIAVVSERWLDDDRSHAWYPTDYEQCDWEKLVRGHAEPQHDWLLYRIKVRKICSEF